MMDKKQDPRLLEAQDTIATLKRTIAILQQEKTTHPKLYVSFVRYFTISLQFLLITTILLVLRILTSYKTVTDIKLKIITPIIVHFRPLG